MTIPRATYRLQLGPDLDFAAAARLVPYLQDLGVSHLYLSPVMRARAGSTHGYDVVDPTEVSPELIAGIATDRPRRAVVESLLRIADAIGQRVVAVGPSGPEDVRVLLELGCEAVVSELDLDGVTAPSGVTLPDLVPSEPLVLR